MDRVTVAKKYLSMTETDDWRELKKFIGFDPRETPWCAGFMNAIEKELGRPGTGKLNARSYLKYGYPVTTPQQGDIVVFKRGLNPWQGHVSIFIKQDSYGTYVLGGNQSNSVCFKYYKTKDVLGYRR